MGKTTIEVIKAVQYNEPVTELELKCAIIALHVNRVANESIVAKILAEYEKDGEITKKSLDRLKRTWDRREEMHRDLETYILNSSYDPRLSKEERDNKFVDHVVATANKLHEVLSKK